MKSSLLAAAALLVSAAPAQPRRGFIADYAAVLRAPWARTIIAVAFVEFGLMFGAFTYVGADLHLRFGVSFTLVGLFVGTFAIGGLIYSLSVTGWCSASARSGWPRSAARCWRPPT